MNIISGSFIWSQGVQNFSLSPELWPAVQFDLSSRRSSGCGRTLSRSFCLPVCLAHLTVLPISLSPRPTRPHDEARLSNSDTACRCVAQLTHLLNSGSIKLSAPFHSPAHKKHTKVSQRKHSSRWTYFPKQKKFA